VRRRLHNRLRSPYRRLKQEEAPHELHDLLCPAPATPKFLKKDSRRFRQALLKALSSLQHFDVCVSRNKCPQGNRWTMHYAMCSSLPSSDGTARRMLLFLNELLGQKNHGSRKEKTKRLNEGTAQLFHTKCKNVATAPEAQKCWNLAEIHENCGNRGGIKNVNCSYRGQRRCNFLIGNLTEVICCAVCNDLHTTRWV